MHRLDCDHANFFYVAADLQVAKLRHFCQHLECSLLGFSILDADSFEDAIHNVVPLSVVLEANFSLSDHSQQSLNCDSANFELGLVHVLNGALKNQAELIKGQWFIFHELTEIAECLDCSKFDKFTVSRSSSFGKYLDEIVPLAQGNLDTCDCCKT